MRRVLSGIAFLVVLCAWPAESRAGEVVEFVDGRYLEVRSHTIEGDFIRLVVQRDALIIIPVRKVDTIRNDHRIVYRGEASGAQSISVVQDRHATHPTERMPPPPASSSG